MNLDLSSKVAVVTGASRGIGAEIAKSLALHGAKVVVNYVSRKDKAEEVLADIKKKGADGSIFKADVTVKEEAEAMVAEAIKRYGHLDILVNNAAIGFPMKPFIDYSWEEAEAKITNEMKAMFFTTQAALRDMLKRRAGRIIMISSTISRSPAEGFFSHAAAKAAMDSAARVMAKELGPKGINVNVVGPGLMVTDATAFLPEAMFKAVAEFTPLKRVGMPADVAGIVTFLSSPMADFITGQYIPVSGGSYMP